MSRGMESRSRVRRVVVRDITGAITGGIIVVVECGEASSILWVETRL